MKMQARKLLDLSNQIIFHSYPLKDSQGNKQKRNKPEYTFINDINFDLVFKKDKSF